MIYLKIPRQINEIEYVNKLGAEFLQICHAYIKPGVATLELEDLAEQFCIDKGVLPVFKGYKGYPFCICVSINEEILHGFPSGRIIKNGDIVSIDFSVKKGGYFSDAAFTKCVGKVLAKTRRLVEITEKCLYKGIEGATNGGRRYDISWAVHRYAMRMGFDVLRDYVGHGVGLELHEEPKIPNYVDKGINWKLRVGMVLTVEPMVVSGTYKTEVQPNGWTVVMADKKMSAHFEHSIAILENGPKILSKL